MFKKENKNLKGITLIALVITIIVIIIIAGVTINLSLGDNGIFNKAKQAKELYQTKANEEAQEFAKFDSLVSEIAQGMSGSREIDEDTLKNLQAISRTTYADLFAIIGTTYGSGNGSTTFNVPDLRGEFLRGTGTNSHANQGSGASVGTHQDGTINYQIQGSYTSKCLQLWNGTDWGSDYSGTDSTIKTTSHQRFDVSGASIATNENYNNAYTSRPTNTSVLYCIKY